MEGLIRCVSRDALKCIFRLSMQFLEEVNKRNSITVRLSE